MRFQSFKENIKKALPLCINEYINYYGKRRLISEHKRYSDQEIENYVSCKYREQVGRVLNWDQPQTYTEKLNVSKVYNSSEIKTRLSDKYLVREWVKNTIGEQYLIPLVGKYNSFDDIDFATLPNEFVMKCNHDSGSVTICEDKNKIHIEKLKRKYKFALDANFGYIHFEQHYIDIKPCIMIEHNLGSKINDYKFLCFDGVVYYCWVDVDRFGVHKRYIYDTNWNLAPFNQHNYNKNDKVIDRPSNLDEMIRIATKLSAGFDQVRVDLYDVDGRIYFGEMTFTNGSGLEKIVPEDYDYVLGKLWNFKSNRVVEDNT